MRGVGASRALVALIGATGCLLAVAYASGATSPREQPGRPVPASQPPRPRIVKHPARPYLSSTAVFSYTSTLAGASFLCRLDDAAWRSCGPRIFYRGLAAGPHAFQVRAEAKDGTRGQPRRFAWVRTAPKRFGIEPKGGPDGLYPGAPPAPVPLLLTNPNPAPILVTSLRVSVPSSPAGCDSATNLELIPSSVSAAKPLRIPANGSVALPTAKVSAPALALRELPFSQDACRGASFPLSFSGEARG